MKQRALCLFRSHGLWFKCVACSYKNVEKVKLPIFLHQNFFSGLNSNSTSVSDYYLSRVKTRLKHNECHCCSVKLSTYYIPMRISWQTEFYVQICKIPARSLSNLSPSGEILESSVSTPLLFTHFYQIMKHQGSSSSLYICPPHSLFSF